MLHPDDQLGVGKKISQRKRAFECKVEEEFCISFSSKLTRSFLANSIRNGAQAKNESGGDAERIKQCNVVNVNPPHSSADCSKALE